MGNLKKLANSTPEFRRNVMRRMGQLAFVDLLTGVFLFAGAGTFHWHYAWIYVTLCGVVTLLAPFVSPLEIMAERGSKKENVEQWDKFIVKILALSGFGIYLISGLDFRWHWTSGLSTALHICAIFIFLTGFALMVWAMYSNRFFSTAVRIQFDRGQEVSSSGPYRYIRHPGYLGMIVYYLATPIFLGSFWAMIPAIMTMLLFIIRTALEDRMLIQKLPEYQEYAIRTRYRLIPGVW